MIKVSFNNETHKLRGLPMEEAWHKVCPPDAQYQCPNFVPLGNSKTAFKVVSSITNLPVGEVMSVPPRRG